MTSAAYSSTEVEKWRTNSPGRPQEHSGRSESFSCPELRKTIRSIHRECFGLSPTHDLTLTSGAPFNPESNERTARNLSAQRRKAIPPTKGKNSRNHQRDSEITVANAQRTMPAVIKIANAGGDSSTETSGRMSVKSRRPARHPVLYCLVWTATRVSLPQALRHADKSQKAVCRRKSRDPRAREAKSAQSSQ